MADTGRTVWADGFWADDFWAVGFWATEAPVLVPVPDVVGDSQAAGTATLEGDLFVVAVVTAYSNIVPAGTIISQSPIAGVEAPEGSTVTITVSLGDAPVQNIIKDGTLFDAANRMGTVFLAADEAVPASAHFIEGIAHSAVCQRYVAAWPVSGNVHYISGFAVRNDGAQIVALNAVPSKADGVGLTYRGELCVTESPPTNGVSGWGTDALGRLSVTDGD